MIAYVVLGTLLAVLSTIFIGVIRAALLDQVRSLLGASNEVRQQNSRLYWQYWYDSISNEFV
jgi:hypothetical protein